MKKIFSARYILFFSVQVVCGILFSRRWGSFSGWWTACRNFIFKNILLQEFFFRELPSGLTVEQDILKNVLIQMLLYIKTMLPKTTHRVAKAPLNLLKYIRTILSRRCILKEKDTFASLQNRRVFFFFAGATNSPFTSRATHKISKIKPPGGGYSLLRA